VVCEELIYSLVALIFPWPSLQHSYDLELTDVIFVIFLSIGGRLVGREISGDYRLRVLA